MLNPPQAGLAGMDEHQALLQAWLQAQQQQGVLAGAAGLSSKHGLPGAAEAPAPQPPQPAAAAPQDTAAAAAEAEAAAAAAAAAQFLDDEAGADKRFRSVTLGQGPEAQVR